VSTNLVRRVEHALGVALRKVPYRVVCPNRLRWLSIASLQKITKRVYKRTFEVAEAPAAQPLCQLRPTLQLQPLLTAHLIFKLSHVQRHRRQECSHHLPKQKAARW